MLSNGKRKKQLGQEREKENLNFPPMMGLSTMWILRQGRRKRVGSMIVMGNLLKRIRRIIDTGMIGTKTLLVSQTALIPIEKRKTEKGGKRIREKGKKKGS